MESANYISLEPPRSLRRRRHPSRVDASATPVANSKLISLQPSLYHIENIISHSYEYKKELSYCVKNILAEAGAALSPALGATL